MEKQYQTMITRDAFRNLKVSAGDVSASESARSNTLHDAIDLNKLFYTRFDSKDFTSGCTELRQPPERLPVDNHLQNRRDTPVQANQHNENFRV